MLTAAFTINRKSVKGLKVYTNDTTLDGMSDSMVYLFDGTKRLKNGTDYTLEYDSNLTVVEKHSQK